MELLTGNSIIQDIVEEVKLLDELEQRTLLTRLRVQKLATKKWKPISKAKGIKPLSMKQIDQIKHKARENAGK